MFLVHVIQYAAGQDLLKKCGVGCGLTTTIAGAGAKSRPVQGSNLQTGHTLNVLNLLIELYATNHRPGFSPIFG